METVITTAGRGEAVNVPPRRANGTGDWNEWDGLLVLDARGRVTFCNRAAVDLLKRDVARIVGQQVTRLIPELPFEHHMPEFNLAYVACHGGEGLWTRRPLWTADGRRVTVEVSLGDIEDIGRRSIVLILKQQGAAFCSA